MGVQLKNNQKVGRNDPCPCGSKLKFKWCHGDGTKKMICNRVANEHMCHLVLQEQKKRGVVPWKYECGSCGYGFDEPVQGQLSNLPLCPNCQSTDLSTDLKENPTEILENGGEDECEKEI